jgi:hypothetical protein
MVDMGCFSDTIKKNIYLGGVPCHTREGVQMHMNYQFYQKERSIMKAVDV